MSDAPILLFLHGVGAGDLEDEWQEALETALSRLGYPDLSEATVLAPKYPNGLRGVDDGLPMPDTTIRVPRGDAGKAKRREFYRRRTAMEVMLGWHDHGKGLPAADNVASVVVGTPFFSRADNYVNDPKVRAWVLNRILGQLPESGRLVIVGHSLGSVIAADLVRRLPAGIDVAGLVTIGSPLAQSWSWADGLRAMLARPPQNLAWWVNFWGGTDVVPARRGVSQAFPWALDVKVDVSARIHPKRAHSATSYLNVDAVAFAIGNGLFGSLSTDIVLAERGLDIAVDYTEKRVLLALRYAHLTMHQLKGDTRDRYAEALRHAQATTVGQLMDRCRHENRPIPTAVARVRIDLSDPVSAIPEPEVAGFLLVDESLDFLSALVEQNVLQPYEIKVSSEKRQAAMKQLTLDMQLGSDLGSDVFEAGRRAKEALEGSTSRAKWVAMGLGAAALAAATGGLALAAAPGLAGGAAITSALAAFGPGGMVGGLLTAGALASAGGGSLAVGLSAPGTTAEVVEAVVAGQLALAILRDLQGSRQEENTWTGLVDTEAKFRRDLSRLELISDDSAPGIDQLQRKLVAVERALDYLRQNGLGPEGAEATGSRAPTAP